MRMASLAALAAAVVLLAASPAAMAGSGGVGPPGGDGGGHKKKHKGGAARGASLRRLTTRPGKAFFDARHKAHFEFELRGTRRRDLVVTAISTADATPVKSWTLDDVKPGAEPVVRWAGWTNDGLLARQGAYRFVIANANGTPADTSRAEGEPRVRFYAHKFPVRGEHSYGDGLGAGRHHQGFDIPAECGTPLVAARGGTVQWRRFQRGGAGHYLVIDGRRTSQDYVYMHLRERPGLEKGDRVHTGQFIGQVGSTGHSTGCHLHLEVWSGPGWGNGGDFLDAEAMAKHWDVWS